MILEAAGMGLLGGVARAAVGLIKALRTKRKIKWMYALITVVCSAVIGATAGLLFDSDPKLSIIAGYAGTDLLENMYKIMVRKVTV